MLAYSEVVACVYMSYLPHWNVSYWKAGPLAYFIHVCNPNTYQVVWHTVNTQYLFIP